MHEAAIRALVSSKSRARALALINGLISHLEEVLAAVRLVRVLTVAELDYIMSFGERLSAHILTEVLNDRDIPSEYLNARKIVVTDAHFGAAAVDFKATNAAVRKYFRSHKKLQVVTGFIGATPKKRTTTLGRGGSDYSAAVVGAALGARVIEIWTDVSYAPRASCQSSPSKRRGSSHFLVQRCCTLRQFFLRCARVFLSRS